MTNWAKEFPKLSFWYVTAAVGAWLVKSEKQTNYNLDLGECRIFCTLEKSLSLEIALQFIKKNKRVISIESDSKYDNDYNFSMHNIIIFAETKKVYSKKDIDDLKRDYIIVQLTGLTQI